jgi:hypothetical protein
LVPNAEFGDGGFVLPECFSEQSSHPVPRYCGRGISNGKSHRDSTWWDFSFMYVETANEFRIDEPAVREDFGKRAVAPQDFRTR